MKEKIIASLICLFCVSVTAFIAYVIAVSNLPFWFKFWLLR